jgi:hypothetical protein
MAVAEATAIVKEIGAGQIDRVEGTAGSMVILLAMLILFGAAAYFTGRLYGKAGITSIVAGIVIVFFWANGTWRSELLNGSASRGLPDAPHCCGHRGSYLGREARAPFRN